MTSAVKDELSRLTVTKPCCRKAEMAALLRFAGGLHLVAGKIVIEADLDAGSTARRLRKEIAEVYGHASDVHVVAPGGLRKGNRWIVRVSKDGDGLARVRTRASRSSGTSRCGSTLVNHDPGPNTTQSASSTARTASLQAGGSTGRRCTAATRPGVVATAT